MTKDDFEAFAHALTKAWAMQGETITSIAIEGFFEALEEFELPRITQALTRHVKDPDTGQYVPKVADIIRYIHGGKGDRATQAWDKAIKAVSKVGGYQTVYFDDALIHAVIADMGGWIEFTGIDYGPDHEKMPFIQREFCQRYQAYMLHPPARHARTLTGILEATNRINGHLEHLPEPLAIGNPSLAKQVYLTGGEPSQVNRLPVSLHSVVMDGKPMVLISDKARGAEPSGHDPEGALELEKYGKKD